jgi:thiol:disulfide interchange protein
MLTRDSTTILYGYWIKMTNPRPDAIAARNRCDSTHSRFPSLSALSLNVRMRVLLGTFALTFLSLLQPLAAQGIKGFSDPLKPNGGQSFVDAKPEAEVTTTLTPQSVQPGDAVTLNIAVEVPQGSHIYSMSKSFGGGSKVKFTAEEGVEGGTEFAADHPPLDEFVKEFDQKVEKYKAGVVTFSRKYKVQADASKVRIQGTLTYQICDAMDCRTIKNPFEVEVAVGKAGSDAGSDGTPAEAVAIPKAAATTTDLDPKFTFVYEPKTNHAKTTVRLVPTDAKPGDTVTLEIRIDLDPEWHTFTTTLPEGRAATATELEVDEHAGLTPQDSEFTADRDHQIKTVKPDKGKPFDQEIYEKHVTWSRKFVLAPETSVSQVQLKGSFAFQVCNEKRCILAKKIKYTFPNTTGNRIAKSTAGGADSKADVPASIVKIPSIVAEPAAIPGEASKAIAGVKDLSDLDCGGTGDADIRDKGVIYVLGVAFVFGLLALLTPCVFPMVPITVSFFLKQAEKRNSSPLKMALVYSGSIILTFTVLGLVVSALFGATYINTLANGIWLNLFLGLVLLFFSLNLLGLFDIAIPSWLLTFTGNKESSGGYVGVFFMALTFTLTSFTCTFAFLGLILVWAANGEIWWPLAGLVSFSTAFALPFFLLALFPSYLHKLPKSGGWMNRVKVVMGFIELAFMLKFLSVADIGWNGGPTFLDYHMVMTAWMVLAAMTGFYLLGKVRLPHDTPTEYIGVFPMVMSMLFLGLSGYIGVGLFGAKPPEGFLGRQITAFAPPQLEGGAGVDGPYIVDKHDHQRYLLDFEAAKQAAIRDQKPLFIDFTGVNCINCRLMEEEVMTDGGIQKKLEDCIRVRLYCDVMPSKAVSDPVLAERLVTANQELQTALVGDASLPSYAVVSSDGTTIFSKKAGRVSTADFNAFMSCGVSKFVKVKQVGVALTAAD